LDKLTELECWQAIIWFGLNTATYKPALSLCYLNAVRNNKTSIQWSDLSRDFLNVYRTRLQQNAMPQQGTLGRQTKLERIVQKLEIGNITESEAIDFVSKEGFVDVVPRFHTIGRDVDRAANRFYEVNFGRNIVFKDTLQQITEEHFEQLVSQSEARWAMLEGAFHIQHSNYNFSLSNSIREMYLKDGYARKPLTNLKPFLAPFQANVCFYCGHAMTKSHVDHVLPRQVLHHDKLWNLVIAHEECNDQKLDRLVPEHMIYKLIKRNENIMGSTHKRKAEIYDDLGSTKTRRASMIWSHYQNVREVLGPRYWVSKEYNPETDPIHTNLITKMNGG